MQFLAYKILGLPVVAWGGITVLILVTLQVLIGARIIKTGIKYHKTLGLTILALAFIHGALAIIYILGA
ncbi:MAG: hypothetical protein WCP14_02180 [bacterium]